MKTMFIATLLATAVGASFAAAPTAALNHDPATYRNVTQQAAADYKMAIAKCSGMTGNAKSVCTEEAKAARAHAEADAVAQYNNTPKGRTKARTAVADADFKLAKAKCGDMTGADKDACVANASSIHTAAVADVKADREIAATGITSTTTPVAGTTATVVENTKEMAATAADKTRNAAAIVEEKSAVAAHKSGAVIADSVITTKVKADIFKEPELKSMAIHVETEKGVVMLSGFVDSNADAEKAVRLAKSVEGVSSVKSAIKVK